MAKRSYKSDVHKRKTSEIFDSVIRDVTPVMRGLRELTTQLTGTNVNPDSSTRMKSYAAGFDLHKLFSELSEDEKSFLMHSAKLGNAYTRML
jgi:hypothetical protein